MPYRSPEWVRQNSRDRTIDTLNQLRGNRVMHAKVPYQDYLEAMDERLSDALDTNAYTSEELQSLAEVRNELKLLMDSPAEHRTPEAISAVEPAAERAFMITAECD